MYDGPPRSPEESAERATVPSSRNGRSCGRAGLVSGERCNDQIPSEVARLASSANGPESRTPNDDVRSWTRAHLEAKYRNVVAQNQRLRHKIEMASHDATRLILTLERLKERK